MNDFDKQVERNLRAIEHERRGDLANAIELYEANVKEQFDGSHPYNRLAIIYRKLGKKQDEVRILEMAISVFKKVVNQGRSDGLPKLRKFEDRLSKIQ